MIHELWEVTGENYQRGSSYYKWPNSEVSVRIVWPTRDGYVGFMPVFSPARAPHMVQLVKWMDEEGMADDFLKGIDWANLDFRFMSQAEAERIQGYFARFFQTKTKAELQEGGRQREIGLQPICTPKDILEHPQLEARHYWQELQHTELGTAIPYPGRFCLMSEAPCRQWRRAPLIGEHNREVYQGELGLSDEELDRLKQAGII
jgi:benzylsuccinate CoA-transferase BbsE subunit/naphthyl-2-methylsuccinate CoA transferase subunit